MKLRIEVSENGEEEIIIRCKGVTDEIMRLQNAVSSVYRSSPELSLSIGETEYFVPVEKILFFETQDNRVAAHTAENMYYTDRKLYELSAVLPYTFVRVSKSCILNSARVCAIDKNLTGASTAHFSSSRKTVSVSRMYYGGLKNIINETRFTK